jgi:hypothetical protein
LGRTARADFPCFQRFCTNSTKWSYKGLILVGIEKASMWTPASGPGNFILQMLQNDKTRCIPIAFTMARVHSLQYLSLVSSPTLSRHRATQGRTTEELEYSFTWWTNVRPASIPSSQFVPPASCSHTRADHSVDLQRDHPELVSVIRSSFVRA